MPDDSLLTADNSTPGTVCGLELLRQVRLYAQEFQCSPWDFAVGIAAMRSGGFTDNDLRWLVLNGYLEHARELPRTNGRARQFRHFGSLTFTGRSCFVPTDVGSRLTEMGTMQAGDPQIEEDHASEPPSAGSEESIQPTWDAVQQQLRWGQEIVKSFKHPSVLQTVILSAFQDANWPPRIDDPLPQPRFSSVQLHLQEVIDSLNRNQRNHLIHFAQDESGCGVIWKHAEPGLY